MNSTERMIYDKYAYDKTFQYVFRVYMEFERRVNVTPEYDGLKYGECRCNLKKWQNRLRISEKQLRKALEYLTKDGVIKRTFKGLKGKGSSIYLLTRFEDTNKDTNEDTNKDTNKCSESNGLDTLQDTNKGSNKDTKKGNTSKNSNLRIISKYIYTEIFDYWISKGVYKHRELTKNMENAIERTLKDYTLEQIKEAIDNYSEMYKSDYKYCSYKWTLIEFLTRTQDKTNERQLELHLKEGVSYKRYLEYKSKAKDPVEEKTNLEIIDGYEYETV